MGEFVNLIDAIKKNRDEFEILIKKMDPLINKYARLLYKDNNEDVRSELLLSLWIAVCNISYYENDGQVVKYLTGALRNRYLELYKKSKKIHDREIGIENVTEDIAYCDYFDDVAVQQEIEMILGNFEGTKRQIALLMINEYSDTEIANNLKISRQYVNRIRRMLKECWKKLV